MDRRPPKALPGADRGSLRGILVPRSPNRAAGRLCDLGDHRPIASRNPPDGPAPRIRNHLRRGSLASLSIDVLYRGLLRPLPLSDPVDFAAPRRLLRGPPVFAPHRGVPSGLRKTVK